jgi:Arc/MetJ family transcription regulator
MECTIVIDDRLLQEARAALGTSSVQETVEAGLKAAIQRQREAAFLASIEGINLDMTEDDLLRLRRAEIERLQLNDSGELVDTSSSGASR